MSRLTFPAGLTLLVATTAIAAAPFAAAAVVDRDPLSTRPTATHVTAVTPVPLPAAPGAIALPPGAPLAVVPQEQPFGGADPYVGTNPYVPSSVWTP